MKNVTNLSKIQVKDKNKSTKKKINNYLAWLLGKALHAVDCSAY